jgi:hypothetical protein
MGEDDCKNANVALVDITGQIVQDHFGKHDRRTWLQPQRFQEAARGLLPGRDVRALRTSIKGALHARKTFL